MLYIFCHPQVAIINYSMGSSIIQAVFDNRTMLLQKIV